MLRSILLRVVYDPATVNGDFQMTHETADGQEDLDMEVTNEVAACLQDVIGFSMVERHQVTVYDAVGKVVQRCPGSS